MVQNSIYVARGLLIESQAPVWLYGTFCEHAVYYQYNFHKAQNVFAGMIQTESPYYQPTPQPPAPFEGVVGVLPGDPDYKCQADGEFGGCDESWAVIMRGSANVFIAGAGLYSWFSTYGQSCISDHACQKVLMLLKDNHSNVRITHLITIGAKYMAVQDGVGIPAIDNLNVESHPRWSQISILDVSSGGHGLKDNVIWIDPSIWEMHKPSFTCEPPCTVKLPPWTSATKWIDYPLLTVSQDAWTSTITKAPLTIAQWTFELVTLEAPKGKLQARQDFSELWPVQATSTWPAVRYRGPDGKVTTTSPTVSFPAPPPTINADAPPPNKGVWPRDAVLPIMGSMDFPVVGNCSFFDPSCYMNPLSFEPAPDAPDDEEDEPQSNEDVVCPEDDDPEIDPETPQDKPKPKPPPAIVRRIGRPKENKEPRCYHMGQPTSHERTDRAIQNFCNGLGKPGDTFTPGEAIEKKIPFSGDPIPMHILLAFKVFDGCQWAYNYEECTKYLNVPVNSCNCAGIKGKQGGTVENSCYWWRLDPQTGDA